MEQILSSLVQQSPNTVAAIVIVIIFVRHLQSRDTMFMQTMNDLTEQIREMKTELIKHSEETSAGMAEMRRAVARKKPVKK